MKKQINVLFCMTFATLLSACNAPKSPDVNVKIPDIKVDPKTEELLAAFSTCNKSDSELPLAQLDPNENITVKDTIENKDIIEVNCDKKQTPKGRGPVRELSQLLTIEAPADLSEKVNYVTIEN